MTTGGLMCDGYMETMSERLYIETGQAKKIHNDQDKRESIVDIYVSSESLRVFDTPWTEDMSPTSPVPAGARHMGKN